MSERHFEQSMNPKEHIQSELEDSGISHPSEWRKALDLETPLDEEEGKIEPIGEKKREIVDLKNLDRIFTYLEGGLRLSDRSKIERFGTLKDGLERLKSLQSMSVAEATEAVRDFGLTPGAYNYLARRLEFYQKYIAGEATRKVNTQEWDEKKREYVDVVKEEVIDASQASPETIKLGVIRDIYYAAMQGTPEMGAVKVATNRINRGIERQKQSPRNTSRSGQNLIKSVVEFHGYYSGIFEGSLGQYPEVSQLYKQCEQEIKKRFGNKDLDEKELEHKAVLLTARRLEGAYNYNGTLNTGLSPYNAGFKESITVGQLGHGVMRQMRGMRSKIQETNFSNVERFIGKSGDNRYGFEKKKLDKDVKSLEDFTQDNQSYDASFLPAKSEDGTDRQIKGREAAEIMTRQKNSEAVQRAKLWFGRESDKINHWFEKSKTKIAGYDISEEERNSIYSSVQERYNKKIDDLRQEYQGEIARLENRTPDELLGAFKERQVIVNKRFEKRKSLAQKALDLHFRFNHEGREYGSKPFDQIDWVNNAPFGVIKRAHRALSAGADDQTIMMRALAEVNGESTSDQNPEKFILNILKSGRPDKVIQNFEKFSGITEDQHLNILLAIIGSGAGRDAVESLNKFTGITPNDHLRIVQALNGSNAGETVITNLEIFSGIKSEEKRDVLIGAIRGGGGYQFAQNFEKFSDVFNEKDHPEIVSELSKAGAGGTVIDNFQKFSGIPVEEHRPIVLEAIKGGGSYQVIQNLEKFSGITEKDHRDIVIEIIKARGGSYLNYYGQDNLNKFKGLEEGLRQVIKAGKYEALPQVLEAGFTIEEITRFPFLISPLVTKK
jgi:hypothetical protein